MNKHGATAEQVGYNFSITGRHVMVTEAMKNYAMEKLSKLERIAHRILEVHMIMDIQKLEHRVDIIIKFNHIKIKVQAASDDMYVSIDRAIDKLQTQIRRYKERIQEHQAKGRSVVEMNVSVVSPPSHEELINEDIDTFNSQELVQKYHPHQVVNSETRPLKLLNTEEAIMKMELSQDQFMVYRCEQSHKLKVIYRRQDGNYGIIQTE